MATNGNIKISFVKKSAAAFSARQLIKIWFSGATALILLWNSFVVKPMAYELLRNNDGIDLSVPYGYLDTALVFSFIATPVTIFAVSMIYRRGLKQIDPGYGQRIRAWNRATVIMGGVIGLASGIAVINFGLIAPAALSGPFWLKMDGARMEAWMIIFTSSVAGAAAGAWLGYHMRQILPIEKPLGERKEIVILSWFVTVASLVITTLVIIPGAGPFLALFPGFLIAIALNFISKAVLSKRLARMFPGEPLENKRSANTVASYSFAAYFAYFVFYYMNFGSHLS